MIGPHVGIEQDQVVMGRRRHAGMNRGGEALVALMDDRGHLRKFRRQHLEAGIPGGIIHHQDLPGPAIRLRRDQDRRQVLAQQFRPVEVGDDEADRRQGHFSHDALWRPGTAG